MAIAKALRRPFDFVRPLINGGKKVERKDFGVREILNGGLQSLGLPPVKDKPAETEPKRPDPENG